MIEFTILHLTLFTLTIFTLGIAFGLRLRKDYQDEQIRKYKGKCITYQHIIWKRGLL